MKKELGWVISAFGLGWTYHAFSHHFNYGVFGLVLIVFGMVLSYIGKREEMRCQFCDAPNLKTETHCEYCRSDMRPQPIRKNEPK